MSNGPVFARGWAIAFLGWLLVALTGWVQAAEIKVGSTFREVVTELGRPRAVMQNGDLQILQYENNLKIELQAGRVIQITGKLPPPKVAPPPASAGAEGALVEQAGAALGEAVAGDGNSADEVAAAVTAATQEEAGGTAIPTRNAAARRALARSVNAPGIDATDLAGSPTTRQNTLLTDDEMDDLFSLDEEMPPPDPMTTWIVFGISSLVLWGVRSVIIAAAFKFVEFPCVWYQPVLIAGATEFVVSTVEAIIMWTEVPMTGYLPSAVGAVALLIFILRFSDVKSVPKAVSITTAVTIISFFVSMWLNIALLVWVGSMMSAAPTP